MSDEGVMTFGQWIKLRNVRKFSGEPVLNLTEDTTVLVTV